MVLQFLRYNFFFFYLSLTGQFHWIYTTSNFPQSFIVIFLHCAMLHVTKQTDQTMSCSHNLYQLVLSRNKQAKCEPLVGAGCYGNSHVCIDLLLCPLSAKVLQGLASCEGMKHCYDLRICETHGQILMKSILKAKMLNAFFMCHLSSDVLADFF